LINFFFKMNRKAVCAVLCVVALCIPSVGAADETDINNDHGYSKDREAQYLIDISAALMDSGVDDGLSTLSGWDIDRRGGEYKNIFQSCMQLRDSSDEYCVSINTTFDEQTNGKLTFESAVKFTDLTDGFYYKISGTGGETALELTTNDRNICYADKEGKPQKIIKADEEITYGIKAILDIDNQRADIIINGVFLKTVDFVEQTSSLSKIKISTPEHKEMYVSLMYIQLYKNYLVNDRFLSVTEGAAPYDWTVKCLDSKSATVRQMGYAEDKYSFQINDESIIDKTNVIKYFDAASGKVCFELKFLIPQRADGICFSFGSGSLSVLKLVTKGDKLVFSNGTEFCGYSENVWQTLRVEADMTAQTSLIKFNGKAVTQIPFENRTDYVDNLQLSTTIKGKALIWFDDVMVFPIYPDPLDYPEPPQIAESKDYYVGMQQCSLWRNGSHVGWDTISPHKENISYLGFYDEGKKEVSDWEIKWLAEHGIDYELCCWYLPETYKEGALKFQYTTSNYALHDGYFNANYSDRVKFALQWVGGFAQGVNASKVWRENIIPYWVDYYFKDSRYMTVDNKPIIAVWSIDSVISAFGGTEKAKAEFDYLQEVCKQLGYNGVTILGYSQSADASVLSNLKAAGLDAIYIYSWGESSYNPDYQINAMQTRKDIGVIESIPTISMGYSPHAWIKDAKAPFITVENYEKVLLWIKDTLMPEYGKNSLAGRMLLIDNWNEHGEGHFMMPGNLFGFKLLDKIRSVFANGSEHKDARPDEAQLERLRGLYPKGRTILRHITPDEVKLPTKVLKGWYFSNDTDAAEWRVEKQIKNLRVENAFLKGATSGSDGGIVMANDLGLDIRNATYIRVRMKVDSQPDKAELFFITKENPDWIQYQSSNTAVGAQNGMYDYYFRLDNNSYWGGTMQKLRLDMSMYNNTGFEIESIEVMRRDEEFVGVKVDGESQSFDVYPSVYNSQVLIPVLPLKGIQDKFKALVVWDNPTQTITISKDSTIMKFIIGKHTANINGKETELGYEPYILEGLPMLPVRLIAETLGGKVSWNDKTNTVEITTKSENKADNTGKTVVRIPYEWEFEVNSDYEGWDASPENFSRTKVKDGILYLKSKTADPMINISGLNIDSRNYCYIRIKLKNSTGSSAMQVFFSSDVTGGASESNSMRVVISTQDNDFKEYEIDMSANSNWKGNITSLRLDPVSSTGVVEIDYIRLSDE